MNRKSLFENAPDLVPERMPPGLTTGELVEYMGNTSFEARRVFQGARLFRSMVESRDIIWLGIAGAGIAGGMGGMVISLLEAGFIDVICSTGAQVYHDLHFAFGLPVKRIHPAWDDDLLRKHGDTRIYDIGIREHETLEAQDEIIRRFTAETYDRLSPAAISSWEFNYLLGKWVQENAEYPERSFVVKAAETGVPIFWDSLSNHSIAMNLLRSEREGLPVIMSAQKDIFDSAAIAFAADGAGFVELGGGGPKNFIQQTGPTISQILGVDFHGADRGLQIGTAVEREGSLSSCTFGEAVTWGKYRADDIEKLVQIWGEYSVIFPLLTAYVLQLCQVRKPKNIVSRMPEFIARLDEAV